MSDSHLPIVMNLSQQRAQVVGIDILRFFAAVLVFWYHLAFGSWTFVASFSRDIGVDFSGLSGLRSYAESGWIGVEIFFVISGFVIAFTAQGSSPGQFLESRILRLVPAAWICASITSVFLAGVSHQTDLLAPFLRSVTFFPIGPYVVGVYWTLAVEIVFYAGVFILLASNRFDRIEPAVLVLGGLSALYWLMWLWSWLTMPQLAAVLARIVFSRIGQLSLLEHGCFFGLGVLMWLIMTGGLTRRRLIFFLVFALAGWVQIFAECLRIETELKWSPATIWSLSMALMIVAIRYNGAFAGIGAFFTSAMRVLGLSTYPLYLIHYPIGTWITGRLYQAGYGWPVSISVSLISVPVMAVVIALHPERWLRRVIRSLLYFLRLGPSNRTRAATDRSEV
jgi:peptidoglycan/LPS O-acetylase OafA/YrhL